MKFVHIILIAVVSIVFSSCATTKIAQQGHVAYSNGQYNEALTAYEQFIKSQAGKKSPVLDTVFFKAGMACMELKKTDLAQKYLEAAEDNQFAAPELYASLAQIYKGVDNLSMELEALENFHNKFPEAKQANDIHARLFDAYVESEQWQKAYDLWPFIKENSAQNIDKLNRLFIVYDELEKVKEGNDLANQLLKLDANNLAALEWNAKKYYNLAEDRYMSEMTAYKKNRTNKQYKKLLKAWDVIWPQFDKSLNYFLNLYKLDPQPKYAKYIANIYTRKDKKKKAAYYKKLSKQ
jgi:hypothetical protein